MYADRYTRTFKTFVDWCSYVHHILSLFNIVSCNWNALGPAISQSSDSIVEELLILLFHPAICRAHKIPLLKIVPSHEGIWTPYLHCVSKSSHLLVVCISRILTNFQIFALLESVQSLIQNSYDTTHVALGMLLHYLGKFKIRIFCWCGRKRKQIAF